MLGRLLDRLARFVNIEWRWSDFGDVEWGPACGLFGCENHVPGDYDWQMCDDCYAEMCEVEDSGMDAD